jgi:exodeoxyribonuclease V
MNIDLNTDQVYALYDLENWWNTQNKQVIEVSGAAGTGKTTLIKYFIDRLELKMENVLFVAFMGKAAVQMARTGLPAKTIHSAIYDYVESIARDEDGKMIIKSNGKPKIIHRFELKDHLSKKIKLIVVDEGSMVDPNIGRDLLSFNIPVVVLGDLNQLPPVFGDPFFLKEPDIILKQIMRQAENDPIVWLANQVLDGNELKPGVYGNSAVIKKSDITDFNLKKADMIITGTNKLRYNINQYMRESIKGIKKLEYPHVNEKVICKKNNWGQSIGDNIYLMNGLTGFVDTIYRESYNKKSMKMDFRPDFSKKIFRGIEFDYKHMYSVPGTTNETDSNPYNFLYDKFEYGYAITTHSSQGSSWENVLYFHEPFLSGDDNKKLLYTGITRASKSVVIVI